MLVKIKESEEKLFLKKEAGGGNILPDGSRNFSTGLHICQDSVNKQNTFVYLREILLYLREILLHLREILLYLREIFLQQRNRLKHLNLHDSSYLPIFCQQTNTFVYLREIFLQQRNSLKHLNLHDSSYLKRDSKECFANSLLQILYFLCNLIPVTPISFQSNTT